MKNWANQKRRNISAFSRPIVGQPSVLMVTTVGSLKHSEIEHTIKSSLQIEQSGR